MRRRANSQSLPAEWHTQLLSYKRFMVEDRLKKHEPNREEQKTFGVHFFVERHINTRESHSQNSGLARKRNSSDSHGRVTIISSNDLRKDGL
jgi:hypothetical protein